MGTPVGCGGVLRTFLCGGVTEGHHVDGHVEGFDLDFVRLGDFPLIVKNIIHCGLTVGAVLDDELPVFTRYNVTIDDDAMFIIEIKSVGVSVSHDDNTQLYWIDSSKLRFFFRCFPHTFDFSTPEYGVPGLTNRISKIQDLCR